MHAKLCGLGICTLPAPGLQAQPCLCMQPCKIFGQNIELLERMTPGEIGTIDLRIILWLWYPNFSQMCHGI